MHCVHMHICCDMITAIAFASCSVHAALSLVLQCMLHCYSARGASARSALAEVCTMDGHAHAVVHASSTCGGVMPWCTTGNCNCNCMQPESSSARLSAWQVFFFRLHKKSAIRNVAFTQLHAQRIALTHIIARAALLYLYPEVDM